MLGSSTLSLPRTGDMSLASCYRRNEEDKKRKYDERVREMERGCFALLVFPAAGGFPPISGAFISLTACYNVFCACTI